MAVGLPRGVGFAFDMGVRALDEQLRRLEALDSKAGITVAADGILGGLLFGRGAVISTAPRAITSLLATGLVLSLFLALLAFMTRRYEFAPTVSAAARFMAAEETWIKWRLLGNLLDAVGTNNRKLMWKSRVLTAALISLLGTVGIVGGYFIYAALFGRLIAV